MENNSTSTITRVDSRCRCMHRRRIMLRRLRVSIALMESVCGMDTSSPWRGQRHSSEGGCAHEPDYLTRKGSAVTIGRNIAAFAAGRLDSSFESEVRWHTRNAHSHGTSAALRAPFDTRVVHR